MRLFVCFPTSPNARRNLSVCAVVPHILHWKMIYVHNAMPRQVHHGNWWNEVGCLIFSSKVFAMLVVMRVPEVVFENKFWIVYNPQTEMFLLFNSYTPYFLNPKNSSTHLYFSSNLTPDDFELFLKVISTTVARCIFQRCLQESPPPRSSYSETLSRAVAVSCSSALLAWNTHSWNASTTPWGSPNRPVQGPH